MKKLVPNDFRLKSRWVKDFSKTWESGDAMYVIDESTQRKYWNESLNITRFKCFLLIFGTPLIHLFALLIYPFWVVFKKRNLSSFFKIFILPFSYLGLELASFYGILSPLDGRKLYASIERGQYGAAILAPCFQPDPDSHLFGGDLNKKDAF